MRKGLLIAAIASAAVVATMAYVIANFVEIDIVSDETDENADDYETM